MISPDALANNILQKVATFIKNGDPTQLHTFDSFPAAIYVTDIDGFLTYFNPACVDFAGRTPALNRDRWCVTWKLYTNEGDFLPHEECPMAVAIQTRRLVRGVTAFAERPDGIRVKFQPFPTPVVDDNGDLLAAINMLVGVADSYEPAARGDPQATRSERVKHALQTFTLVEIQDLVEEIEIALGRQPPGLMN